MKFHFLLFTFAAVMAAFSACAGNKASAMRESANSIPSDHSPAVELTTEALSDAYVLSSSTDAKNTATAKLTALIHSESASDRAMAAYLNGEFGHALRPEIVLKNLRILLSDSEPKVRLEALMSCYFGCTNITDIALPALSNIEALYNDPDHGVRRAAFSAAAALRAFDSRRNK